MLLMGDCTVIWTLSSGGFQGLSPKGNKKGQNESKSPVQAGKRKEADDSQKSDSPLKKQKLGKKGKKQVMSDIKLFPSAADDFDYMY